MLTEKTILSLKPKRTPYRVFDKRREGLFIQVSTGGTRTFYLKYRFDGRYRFLNLGRHPTKSLKDARAEASAEREYVRRGIDPKIEREERRQESARKIRAAERQKVEKVEALNTGTVADLFQVYVERLSARGKSHDHIREVSRVFSFDVQPVLGAKAKARDIQPSDITEVLRPIVQRRALTQANRTRAYLSAAFATGIKYDHDPANLSNLRFRLEQNPVAAVPRPNESEAPRDRDLSSGEIYRFWRILTVSGATIQVKTGIKLLFATGGQRIIEVMGSRWSEFDFKRGLWELPRERSKNNRPHVIPLQSLAISLLNRLPRTSEYVFPSPRGGHMTDHAPARAVYRLRPAMAANDIDVFTPMDIRRTCKSRMGELGISKEVRDRLHNHAFKDVSEKHYDRYSYLPEKIEAMKLWDRYLLKRLKRRDYNRRD